MIHFLQLSLTPKSTKEVTLGSMVQLSARCSTRWNSMYESHFGECTFPVPVILGTFLSDPFRAKELLNLCFYSENGSCASSTPGCPLNLHKGMPCWEFVSISGCLSSVT